MHPEGSEPRMVVEERDLMDAGRFLICLVGARFKSQVCSTQADGLDPVTWISQYLI
jgi:hypothetical protein